MPAVTRFNPFPGLRPFESDEDYLFFGREGLSEEILRRLRSNRFLAVVGSSGSGKSSLIRAGLLPYLHGGFMAGAGSHWRVAIFRPGDDPIGNLAQALNDPDVLGSPDAAIEDADRNAILLDVTLRRSGLGLLEAVRLRALPEYENVLVIVDQFEELFRFAPAGDSGAGPAGATRNEDDAAAFVKLLLEAVEQTSLPVYVVITMRSDFIGDCARFRDLPETVTAGLYLIPRMTREQRRAAIEEPVRVGGAQIARRLVNRLLNDGGDDPDQLPTLQHALMRTWDSWTARSDTARPIDLDDYTAIGGMAEALSRHAEQAYAELAWERHREIAKRMFQALTEKGPDNREVRRPTTVAEIAAIAGAQISEVVAVIESFRRPGRSFLMPPSEVSLEGDCVIDISHESLIRGWQRLKGWVEEESESAKVYRRLAETAALHAQSRARLWNDPDLSLALIWRDKETPNAAWAKRYHPAFDEAMNFLEMSRRARDAEAAEKESLRRKELTRVRWFAAVLTVLFLASVGLGVGVWKESKILQQRAQKLDNQAAALRTVNDNLHAETNQKEKALEKAEEQTRLAKELSGRALRGEAQAQAQRAEAENQKEKADSNQDMALDYAEHSIQDYESPSPIGLERRGGVSSDQPCVSPGGSRAAAGAGKTRAVTRPGDNPRRPNDTRGARQSNDQLQDTNGDCSGIRGQDVDSAPANAESATSARDQKKDIEQIYEDLLQGTRRLSANILQSDNDNRRAMMLEVDTLTTLPLIHYKQGQAARATAECAANEERGKQLASEKSYLKKLLAAAYFAMSADFRRNLARKDAQQKDLALSDAARATAAADLALPGVLPADGPAWRLLSRSYSKAGLVQNDFGLSKEALANYQRAAQVRRRDPEGLEFSQNQLISDLREAATLQVALDRKESAIETYTQAIQSAESWLAAHASESNKILHDLLWLYLYRADQRLSSDDHGDFEKAEKDLTSARLAAGRLNSKFPDMPADQSAVEERFGNLWRQRASLEADTQRKRDGLDHARRSYLAAVAWDRKIEAISDQALDLAIDYRHLAAVDQESDSLEEALSDYRNAIQERNRDSNLNEDAKLRLLSDLEECASLEIKLKRQDAALKTYAEAIKLAEGWAGAPEAPRIVHQLVWLSLERGDTLQKLGRSPDAEQQFRDAQGVAERLDRKTTNGRFDRGAVDERFGSLWRDRAAAEKDPARQQDDYRKAREYYLAEVDVDRELEPDQDRLKNLQIDYRHLANLDKSSGNTVEAVNDYRNSIREASRAPHLNEDSERRLLADLEECASLELSLGRKGDALKTYAEAIKSAGDWIGGQASKSKQIQHELVWLYLYRGDAQLEGAHYQEAERDFTSAQAEAERVDRNTLDGEFDRSVVNGRFGNLWRDQAASEKNPARRQEDVQKAREYYMAEVEADQKLDSAASRRTDLMIDYNNLVRLAASEKDPARRHREDLGKARKFYLEEVEADRKIDSASDRRANLTNDYNHLVDLAAAEEDPARQEDLAKARKYYLGAVDTDQNLASESDRRENLLIDYEHLASLEDTANNRAGSRDFIDKEIDLLKPLADRPKAPQADRTRLAETLGSRAWHDLLLADHEGAISDTDKGIAYDPRQRWLLTNKAHALMFSGRGPDACRIYVENADKTLGPGGGSRLFRQGVEEDFGTFREHPPPKMDPAGMDKIEAILKGAQRDVAELCSPNNFPK